MAVALGLAGNHFTNRDLPEDVRDLSGEFYRPPLSFEMVKKYGSPQTLEGTDNRKWIAYFPEGDFTITAVKRTGYIMGVSPGKP